MRLDKLISLALAETQVPLQFIEANLVHVSEQRKFRQTKISFVTKDITTSQMFNGSGPIGIVVWIPREVYARLAEMEDE